MIEGSPESTTPLNKRSIAVRFRIDPSFDRARFRAQIKYADSDGFAYGDLLDGEFLRLRKYHIRARLENTSTI